MFTAALLALHLFVRDPGPLMVGFEYVNGNWIPVCRDQLGTLVLPDEYEVEDHPKRFKLFKIICPPDWAGTPGVLVAAAARETP